MGFAIGGERVSRRFAIDIDEPCELGGTESVRQSAGTSVGRAQRLHDCGICGAVRGARNKPRKPEDRGRPAKSTCVASSESIPAVPAGYETLNYTVRIKGSGSNEEFAEVHKAVMATSPNFYNVSRPVHLEPTLVVE